MDINNLKAFIEVADKKSFSRSAESLNLTQPAVSKRIAALESELSAKLFDRVGRTVHLTEAGRVLLPSARQINTELSRIEDVICNLGKDVSGVLSIGTTEHIGTHHLPKVLQPFRRDHPKADIQLHFANSEQTLQAVSEGVLEIALCVTPTEHKMRSELRSIEVRADTMAVVIAKDHPLASDTPVSLNLLSQCPAILPPESSITRRSIDDTLQANGHSARVSTEAEDFETMRSMASIGLGWAVLPEFQIDESLAVLQVEELQMTYSIALTTNRERTLSRAAQALIESLPSAL